MAKFDIATMITNKLVVAMEQAKTDGTNWLAPFNKSEGDYCNVVSGKAYQGINVLMCALFGPGDTQFASYKQWTDMGAQVKKGEKGTEIVYYKLNEYERDSKKNPGEKEKYSVPFLRYSTVFGISQVDNAPERLTIPVNPLSDFERLELVEQYINNTGAIIKAGTQPCYSPITDIVQMPDKTRFVGQSEYYGVVLHELTHWTGSSKRLNRDQSGRFGSTDYAFEELIAEIGAAIQCHTLGIDSEPRADHAHYLNSWIKILKSDNRYIFKASKEATKAVQHIESLQPTNTAKLNTIAA